MKYYDSFKRALAQLKTRAMRGLHAALALIVALAIALTTCAGAWADESANDSALTQTVPAVPQTVAEEGPEIASEDSSSDAATEESEEDKAADTDTSNEAGDSNSADNDNNATSSDSASSAPEASATPEAQADTEGDEGVAAAAEGTTILDDFGARSLNKANTFDATIAILNEAEDMAMVADPQSGGMRAVPVSELDANNKNWQWQWQTKRKEYDGQNYFITLQRADTGQYLGWRNSEFVFVDDENDAAVFNLGEDAGAKYRLQNRTADWPTVYFNKGSNAFVTDVNWSNQTVQTHIYVKDLAPENDPHPVERDFSVKTKDIVSPKNTVVNLFDYWTTGDEISHRNDETPGWGFVMNGDPKNHSNGVNKNNALKFVSLSNGNNGYGNMNVYTESNTVRQGIVKPALGSDGYPQLSGSSELKGSNSTDVEDAALSASLAYLFNSADVDGEKGTSSYQPGKKAFMNTEGLLSEDADGYYYYDSSKNYAYFEEEKNKDEKKNKFTLYNSYVACKAGETVTVGGGERPAGQFFPFNTLTESQGFEAASEAEGSKDYCQSGAINHFFGMNLVSSFTQRYGGHVKSDRKQPTTFEFSGDDDVWIFIDGVLVADLGGIHQASGVTINFSTGDVKIVNVGGQEQTTTLKSHFPESMRNNEKLWNGDTFADGSEHTFSFFYLERGSGQSNLKIRYNFREIPIYSLNKVDQYGNPVTGARFAAYRGKQEIGTTTDAGGQKRETKTSCYYTKASNYQECKPIPKGATVNENTGAIMEGNTVWADPILTSETNNEGTLYFKNENGDDYEVGEFIHANDGSQTFLMREIKVPDGYRTVSEDFVLTFAGHVLDKGNGESDYGNLVLVSDDPYGTGVWASLGVTVTASARLTPVPDSTVSSSKDNDIVYYDPSDGSHNGTLFAVVQHRHLDEKWDALTDVNGWKAVYGTEDTGYQEGLDTSKKSSILAAQKQYEVSGGKNVFYPDGNVMKATFENLPGDPTQYYTFVEQEYFERNSENIQKVLDMCRTPMVDDKYSQPTDRFANCQAATNAGYSNAALKALDNVRYVVTYYWTNGTLENATTENTVRVHSHSALDASSSSGFNVVFGSRIRVPNVENRLIFRNLTYDDVPVNTDGQDAAHIYNGSYFALYSVDEAALDNGQTRMFYWATDKNGKKVGIYLNADPKDDGQLSDIAYVVDTNPGSATYGQQIGGTGTYRIDQNGEEDKTLGSVTVKIDGQTYTIEVAKNANGERCVKKTKARGSDGDAYFIEDGMNYFSRLYEGNYVLRQITAPVRQPGTDGAPEQSNTAEDDTYRYAINITETMVHIDSSGIYANAGGDTNGVLVGNGAGYLVKTLNQFASRGILDETLTWIAMFLRVNYAQNFTAFDGFANGTETGKTPWGSASRIDKVEIKDEAGNVIGSVGDSGISRSTTQKLEEAMVTYLQYDPSNATNKTLFDYVPNGDQSGEKRAHYQFCATVDGEKHCTTMGDGEGHGSSKEDDKKMRLYTDEGWSMLNIYQDYSFGSQETKHNPNSGYTSLLGTEITPLFSNSTFVVVYNSPSTTPQIVKVESGTKNTTTVLLNEDQTALRKQEGDDRTCVKVLDNPTKYKVPTENEMAGASEDSLLTCLVGYNTPVKDAQFRISKQDGNQTVYWTAARTWSTNEGDAYTFTSDEYGKVLENMALQAYDTSDLPQPIVYTIEETYAPDGYLVVGGTSVQFSLYNWEGNEEDSHIRIKLAGKDTNRTHGVSVAPDGSTLYIENTKQPQIVKVEEGSDEYVSVLKANAKGKTCADVVADKANGYKTFGPPVNPSDYGADEVLTCLVGYNKTVKGARFEISKEDKANDTVLYYGKPQCKPGTGGKEVCTVWNARSENAPPLQLTSSEFGQIIALDPEAFESGVTYTITETASAPGYGMVLAGGIATFTLGAGNRFVADGSDVAGVRYSPDGMVMYIENEPGFELPSSGGKGLLWWLLMVGLLLVGIALGFAYRQRKQLGR